MIFLDKEVNNKLWISFRIGENQICRKVNEVTDRKLKN